MYSIIQKRNPGSQQVKLVSISSYHSICLDKKDIIYAELDALNIHLNDVSDEGDKKTIKSEIADLKMALDVMT